MITFKAGTRAIAEEVNSNFSEVQTNIENTNSDLEAAKSELSTSVSNLETSTQTKFDKKVDLDGTNATFAHITETYVNGTSGYRIWSDGWCEQWGMSTATSITYLKSFKNTDYDLQVTPHRNQNAQVYWSDFGHTKTINGFTIRLNNYPTDWFAQGYIR